MIKRILLTTLLFVCAASQFTGCAYFQARGRDACDIFDVGITITDKWTPDFALFFDFFSIAPLGFSSVDGKVLGTGNRSIGLMDYEDNCWGVLLWGSEMKGSGVFNPNDPYQARKDQSKLTERPRFNTGILRMAIHNNLPPLYQFFECDRTIHLGWIGIHAIIRPLNLVDFVLGWTTLDIMNDDDVIPLKKTTDI